MRNSNQEKGFGNLVAILILGLGGFLVISSVIPVARNYNDGKSAVAGVYLAKGDDSGSSGGGDSGSHDSGGSSGGSSSSGSSGGSSGSSGGSSSGGGSSGDSSQTSSTSRTTPKPIENETKEVKHEVENKEVAVKEVETETTPEKIKSEIRQGNLRIKFEVKDGKVEVETKVRTGENEAVLKNEAENEAVKEITAELEKEDVKIATAPGQIALVNKRVGALSNFPISVDPTTRQLIVTTPAGTKVVAVLPQKAIDNMLASHVMDDVVSEKVNNSLGSIPDLVSLETKNGVLVYKVKGNKIHKLLGLIPIKTGVEAFVSAENGQVIESTDSLLGRILNRLAL